MFSRAIAARDLRIAGFDGIWRTRIRVFREKRCSDLYFWPLVRGTKRSPIVHRVHSVLSVQEGL
jgi:hypothetical protein